MKQETVKWHRVFFPFSFFFFSAGNNNQRSHFSLHALPAVYTVVMTNGEGHTLALCVAHAACSPVMDSPLCLHHLLLGLEQNQ